MAATKEEKLQDLKKHLATLQEKIADIDRDGRKTEVKELYRWSSPARVYHKKSKRWLINVLLMLLIILVVLLFLEQFILMAAVLAFAFLVYVIDAVPPENTEHRLTSQGLTSADHSYLWEELYDFWFLEKDGFEMLNFDTNLNYPRRIFLLVKKEDKEKIKEILLNYLPFRETPNLSWFDKTSERLAKQIHRLVGS